MWGGDSVQNAPSDGDMMKTDIDASYVGETARPWRERVREHYLNLKNGAVSSFIIAHWMEAHPTIMEAPEFKWQVLDAYSDALRRQLCEGLNIITAGVLNKRLEFHQNIICRLQAATTTELTEKELQKALERKKEYNMRLKRFINIMSESNTVIENKNKKKCIQDVSNLLNCSRYNSKKSQASIEVTKRKRASMESSTPVSQRRESVLLDMLEDSPIEVENSRESSAYSVSEDVLPGEKN